VSTYPSVDESRDRLHRAGWSIGEAGGAAVWIVIGTNGENMIRVEGCSQAEAWWRACEQAAAEGMPAKPRRHRPTAHLGLAGRPFGQAPQGRRRLPRQARIRRAAGQLADDLPRLGRLTPL
jgi:hypothetical protein